MSNHPIGHAAHNLHRACEQMEPLPDRKNPLIAAVVGFLFGFIGIGIYFKSWKDLFICFLIFLPLIFTGVGAPVGWCIAGAYGFFRALNSNEKLDGANGVAANVVTVHPASTTIPLLPAPSTPPPLPAAQTLSVAASTMEERLQKLLDLFRRQLITEAEYQTRRQQILMEI